METYASKVERLERQIELGKTEAEEAFKRGVAEGKKTVLDTLIRVAMRTDGCEVWRSLFSEMLRNVA